MKTSPQTQNKTPLLLSIDNNGRSQFVRFHGNQKVIKIQSISDEDYGYNEMENDYCEEYNNDDDYDEDDDGSLKMTKNEGCWINILYFCKSVPKQGRVYRGSNWGLPVEVIEGKKWEGRWETRKEDDDKKRQSKEEEIGSKDEEEEEKDEEEKKE
ncbi:hypothetical protein M8J77_017312 [Diaphorina citri]|nr:hypothetical protein M8J77_017312 [Diaphorina citri]